MKKLILFPLVLMLSGCASMNKKECQVADWQAVGYQHGARGQAATAFERYRADCSKHDIKADFTAFKRGHQQGLADYCTFEQGISLGNIGQNYNIRCPSSRYPRFEEGYSAGLTSYCSYSTGYSLGQQGSASNSTCAQAEFPDFSAGHADGHVKFEVVQSIHALEDDLLTLSENIQIAEDSIVNAEAVIVSNTSTSAERTHALEDIKQFEREQSEMGYQYHQIEKSLVRLKSSLESM